MKEIATRLLRTLRVERENFVWMDFNDRATGDAFYLVLITASLSFMGIFAIGPIGVLTDLGAFELFVNVIAGNVIAWLLISGIAYAIVRYLFEEHHNFPAILRFVGYAFPTTLLFIFLFTTIGSYTVSLILANGWLAYIVAKGIAATSDLPVERAILAAGGGIIGASIVQAILQPLFSF